MQPSFQIVPMTEEHIPAVAELERQCFSNPWSENMLREEWEQSYSMFIAALEGDEVAGYIGAQFLADCAYICNIAVSPAYRRQGIGRTLLEAMTGFAHHVGMKEITLEVRTSNAPARALYEKLCFVHVGTRPGFYSNPPENAEIYTLTFE